MAIGTRLRYEILKRDNYRCRYCGATSSEARLAVDHVMPAALGGTDTPDNLVAACVVCNAGKTSTAPGGALEASPSHEEVEGSRERRDKEQAVLHREVVRAAILNRYMAAFNRGWSSRAEVSDRVWRPEFDFLIDMEIPEHIVQARAYEAAITPDPNGEPFVLFARLVREGMAKEALRVIKTESAPRGYGRTSGGGYDRQSMGYGGYGDYNRSRGVDVDTSDFAPAYGSGGLADPDLDDIPL